MGDPDKLARLRAEEIDDELPISREERRMASEKWETEREMTEFEDAEQSCWAAGPAGMAPRPPGA